MSLRAYLPVLLCCLLLAGGCAKVVTPVGGPKDTTPPKMVKEQPASKNVRFDGSNIRITFDEFFTLNNPTENVLISPPMDKKPEYLIRNKTLVIKFQDTLKANTTYNMVFSNCIQDYHESNKLSFYHYSFSTGSSLDSFALQGKVVNAEKLTASPDFFVVLYRDGTDSFPPVRIPDYVTKTLADGSFTFSNISAGKYAIFALKDINSNLLYDLPNEEIAFCDSLVAAFVSPASDTVKQTTGRDRTQTIDSNSLILRSFITTDTLSQLLRPENPEAGRYIFPYKTSFSQFEAEVLTPDIDYFQVINPTQDSVTWYMKRLPTDTFSCILTTDGHRDTLTLKPFKTTKAQGRGKQTENVKRLPITFGNAGHYFQPLTLHFAYPIRPVDSFPVLSCSQHDTVTTWVRVPDTFVKSLPLPLRFETKKSYTILIPDSIFFGYNGLTHDTLISRFTLKSEKDYGNLLMKYNLPDNGTAYICQLWSSKNLLQEDILTESTTLNYAHLEPGDYQIRVIEDANGNGRWDSGNLHRRQQPERVFRFPSNIHIRAFWDVEEEFDLP